MKQDDEKRLFPKIEVPHFKPLNIPDEETFNRFKKNVQNLIQLDLTNYKNAQMERRIISLMNRLNIPTLDDYFKILRADEKRLAEFTNMLTINVSEFFRNSERFEELENIYLPELYKKNPRLKIWSAGCSIGAEIYTLAMILDKKNWLTNATLIASDFDQNILSKAKNATYTNEEIGTIKKGYESYVQKTGENKNIIVSKIASKVKFIRQDLLNSPFEKNFDLILCRNVVIYFTEEAKFVLYSKFFESLNKGGILFVGSTERIQDYKKIGYGMRAPFFYHKS